MRRNSLKQVLRSLRVAPLLALLILVAFVSPGAAGAQTVSFARFPAGPNPKSVAVGDFNRDGVPDLVAPNNIASGTVSVLLGNGDGTFQAPLSFAADSRPTSVAVG